MPDGSHRQLPKKQALVRSDTQDVLGVVSPGYQVVRHDRAVDALQEALDGLGYSTRNRTVLTKNGARMFHHVTFNDLRVDIEGSEVALQVVLLNSLDGSCPFDLDLGGYRFICSNGLRAGMSLERVRQKHTKSLNVGFIIKQLQGQVRAFRETLVPFWQAMAEYPMAKDEGQILLTRVAQESSFPERHLKTVRAQWDAPRTPISGGRSVWGAYQAFTHVLSRFNDQHINRARQLNRAIVPAFERVLARA